MAVAPDDVADRFARARLLDLAGRDIDAQQAYLDVLALDMAHAGALNHLGALLNAAGYRGAARLAWEQAVARCPDDPAAYVQLGNLLRRAGDPEARAFYAAALQRDPALPEAHQGMALICADAGEDAAAARHRDLGFGPRALTTAPYRGTATPLAVLQLVSCRGGNIPTRHLLPDGTFLTHTVFAEYAGRVPALPPHALVFNAIGDADLCRPALAAAAALLHGHPVPVLNPPASVLATGRADNAARLGRLPGVIAPRIATLPRAVLAGADAVAALAAHGIGFPLLLRSPGFHTGQHFIKLDRPGDLGCLAGLPGETLMAIEYLDARGTDGFARKYRAMCVGGRILPLHLAIGSHWKLHYCTAETDAAQDHRAEQAAFLRDMPAAIGPVATAALARIAETMALDYAGVDFAVAPDGRLILFEANATMVVPMPPHDPRFTDRRDAAARVLDAVRHLIESRAPLARKLPCQGAQREHLSWTSASSSPSATTAGSSPALRPSTSPVLP